MAIENRESSTWVGLIANPSAGRGAGRVRVEQMQTLLQQRGVNVDLALTQEQRQIMIHKASKQPEQKKILVAIGGDGTVNAVVNNQPDVPFCNFASGTENLFARAIKPEKRIEPFVDWMLQADSRKMDLGSFSVAGNSEQTTRRFALMLGFGFDAAVVNRHHANRISRTGSSRPTSRLAYVMPLAHEALYYGFPPVKLSFADDQGNLVQQVGTTCILFNMDCYALGLRFTPQASAFDGSLDGICFSRPGSIQAGLYFAAVTMGLHPRLGSVEISRMRSVSVEALKEPVPVQMDGDPAGWLEPGKPWQVQCLPKACPILVNGEIAENF